MSAGRWVIDGTGPWFVTDLAEPGKAGALYRRRDDAEAELVRLQRNHTPAPRAQQGALFDGATQTDSPGDVGGYKSGPTGVRQHSNRALTHPLATTRQEG